MKLEIFEIFKYIERSKQDPIETYSVPDLSMLDFQEWKEQNKVTINLDCLSETVATLDSMDPETQKPVSDEREVDFYLPISLREKVFDQRKSQVESEEGSERVFMLKLKSSTILSAVVTEILQNHHPHSKYEVRITDG